MAEVRSVFEVTATVAMLVLALIVVIPHVVDKYVGAADAPSGQMIDGWREYSEAGIWMGRSDAPVVVSEFMDFQCPFSARHALGMDSLRAEFGDDLAVVFHHFPLWSHPFSTRAAIAAECAERQGQFAEVYSAMFEQRDSIGVKPWREYAEIAQVPDLREFEVCMELPADSFPRIGEGKRIGERTDVRGTPTLWVNGEVVRPQLDPLREAVRRALQESR